MKDEGDRERERSRLMKSACPSLSVGLEAAEGKDLSREVTITEALKRSDALLITGSDGLESHGTAVRNTVPLSAILSRLLNIKYHAKKAY